MTVTTDKPAPYAPPTSIIDLIERHRNKGLPKPVNSEVLGRAGIPDSLIARTLQALVTLDLIDDDGNITDVFEGIRLAPEDQYKKRLEEWLNAAYADVLQFVDPSTDGETKVRDAFRTYSPVGQQGRMVTLFIRLFAHAGIQSEEASAAPARAPRSTRSNAVIKPRVHAKPKQDKKKTLYASGEVTLVIPAMDPALEGLLKKLPLDGSGWTQQERDSFYKTFGAVLDFAYPVGTKSAPEDADEDDN